MPRISLIASSALVASAVLASACGGGGGSKTATPGAASASSTAKPATVATGSPPAANATQAASSPAASGSSSVPPSPPSGTSAAPTPASSTSGRIYTAADAKAIVDGSSLLPPDLPSGWKLQTDTVADNAAAAVTDPKGAASFERCVRLLGRTAVNQPFDVVQSFLAGETLAFFSSITVYASEAGAIDCSTAAAQRFAQPGELARALGSLFVNPDAVVVTPVEYPQVADGSFAATLTGQINAAGTTIDLTVLIVAFRTGNVTAVVGSARSGQSPPTDELKPYIDKTLQRINTFTS